MRTIFGIINPLSPYLFTLCIEVISQYIINSNIIEGININGYEFKLLQYADDTTVVLKNEQSANYFFHVIKEFSNISGLKLNTYKTEAIWLGNVPKFKLPYNIKWTTKPVKVLGIYIGWDLEESSRLTIMKKISSIKQLLHSWHHRKLTLNGKVLILKCLALSQLIYIANLIHFPLDLMKDIEALFYEFLWNGKPHKVKKRIIIQEFGTGGHKMIDIDTMIKAQKLRWVRRYLNNHDCLWKSTMEAMIKVKKN